MGAQQPRLADVLQKQLERVGGAVRPEIQPGSAAAALSGRGLDVHARCSGRVNFLDQLDVSALEEAMQLVDIGSSRPTSATAVAISA